jgi:hypothetical protein
MSPRQKKQPVISMPNHLFPGEEQDIRKEIADLVDDPGEWLNTPNTRLGGTKPTDLIGTDREQLLRDLLQAIRYAMPT